MASQKPNNAILHRPHAGWTNFPLLVCALTLTLAQTINKKFAAYGGRYVYLSWLKEYSLKVLLPILGFMISGSAEAAGFTGVVNGILDSFDSSNGISLIGYFVAALVVSPIIYNIVKRYRNGKKWRLRAVIAVVVFIAVEFIISVVIVTVLILIGLVVLGSSEIVQA